jgi:ribosomal protein L25 (general stress protein Ctc)
MSSPIKKKKLDYPHETEGSRLAAETRRRCNKLSAEERREHLRKAMAIIYGSAEAPKAAGTRH